MRTALAPVVLLLVLPLASGCSRPAFEARRTVEETVPLAKGLRSLSCTTDNGQITVVGVADTHEVRMRVEITVQGHTQAEADAALPHLSVHSETRAGQLLISARYDEGRFEALAPAFSYVLELPADLDLYLESHNGDIAATAMAGGLAITTGNGHIRAATRGRKLRLQADNGNVEGTLQVDGPVTGDLTADNGNVVLVVGGALDATVIGSTQNGRARIERAADAPSVAGDSLECRFGNGSGRIRMTTGNGDLVVR